MSRCVSTVDYASLVDLLRARALCQSDQMAATFLVDGERGEIALTYAGLDEPRAPSPLVCKSLSCRASARCCSIRRASTISPRSSAVCTLVSSPCRPIRPTWARLDRTLPRLRAIMRGCSAGGRADDLTLCRHGGHAF